MIDLGPYPDEPGYEEAIALDRRDPLHGERVEFVIADEGLIYLDGNSLGRRPRAALDIVAAVTNEQWGDRLIRSWNEQWWDLQVRIGDVLAPIVGASPGEVIISDSTSVNLYKLAMAALVARPGRTKIVTDDLNFPTDLYVLDGITKQTGHRVEVVTSNGIDGPIDGLAAAIDDDTALVTLSHTVYKSGYTYDLAAVTKLAHEAGALVLWDCSHSVGSVPIDLNGAGADLAVGCTYKYLNGGPGSPAFLYVRADLQDLLENPITAWWGHTEPFAFDLDFVPATGIRRFHGGTMPILSLAAAEAGISQVAGAGVDAIRTKSEALSDYLIRQWRDHLALLGFGLASPADPQRRGSHVSLSHSAAWPITRAVISEANVLPDFRTPNIIRLGLAPLYTTFGEVHTAVHRIKRVVEAGLHTKYGGVDAAVT